MGNIRAILLVVGIISLVSISFGQVKKASAKAVWTKADSMSYVLGLDLGVQLKKSGQEIKTPALMKGIEDRMKGSMPAIDSLRADSLHKEFFTAVQSKMEKDQRAEAAVSAAQNDTFFTNNKKRDGILVTQSGLQYKVIKKSDGAKVKATDTVLIYYKGSLISGAVFDSTPAGHPATFALQRIIPGFAEGIPLMNIGSKYRFFIPPDLGYGMQGAPPRIPPKIGAYL